MAEEDPRLAAAGLLREGAKNDRKAIAELETALQSPEHDAAEQMNRNFDWLLKRMDEAHAIHCPGQHGTWQQRAEQLAAVKGEVETEVKEPEPGKWYSLIENDGGPDHPYDTWIMVRGHEGDKEELTWMSSGLGDWMTIHGDPSEWRLATDQEKADK